MNTQESIRNLKLLLPLAPDSKRKSIIKEIQKLESIERKQAQKNKQVERES